LMQAIDRYNQYIKNKNIQSEYIKHGSTWMNEWKDWLENDIGDVKQSSGLSIDERIAEMNARQNSNIINVTPYNNQMVLVGGSYD